MSNLTNIDPDLLTSIRELLSNARAHLQSTVNHTMVQSYWNVGRLIVEHEQKGEKRATYGQQQLKELSKSLQSEFGKGFTERNLRNMRAFYMAYPIWHAVRAKLSWTHYRILLGIDNLKAREWYVKECMEQNWSARALERQIGMLYYERLLSSQDKPPVVLESISNTESLKIAAKDYLRDPYILEFLNLPYQPLIESNMEQGLMDNLQQFLLELGKGFALLRASNG